ncbi:MAG: hypothetical protein HZB18_11700 [Chloroflexi bacterium]|nr:hypothetical protein [Chloroflexota bacterium]
MRKKRKSNQMMPWAMLAGFLGVSAYILIQTAIGVSAMNDSILIESPPRKVFQVLIDPADIAEISQNIGNVELEAQGLFEKGSGYRRVLYSHGLPNPQEVTVEEFEQSRLLTTKTTLVGFDVTYRYVLEPTSDGKTLLTLEKDGQGGWLIFKPLLIHLLTRPEHDGGHLALIKKIVEEQIQ